VRTLKFHPRLINQSDVLFDHKEEEFLCKGLKHGLRPLDQEQAFTNTIADLAVKIGPGKNPLKKCIEVICNTPIPTLDDSTRSLIKKVRRKIREEELIITKADKGNTIVIMKESNYEMKVLEVLEKCGATVNEEFDFPAHAHVKEVRKVINKSKFIAPGPSQKKVILVSNPTPPLCTVCLSYIRMVPL